MRPAEILENLKPLLRPQPDQTGFIYDPDKMPAGLRAAHQALDLAVDQLYRKAPFTSDEERLEHLFQRYEAMIAKEKEGRNHS